MGKVRPYRRFSELPETVKQILLAEQILQNGHFDTKVLEDIVNRASFEDGGVTWVECTLGKLGTDSMDYQDAWKQAIEERDLTKLREIYEPYFDITQEIELDGIKFVV